MAARYVPTNGIAANMAARAGMKIEIYIMTLILNTS